MTQGVISAFFIFLIFSERKAVMYCMAEILSVGIDIGTSTTQVIFSRIAMENTAAYFAVPHVSIVDKRIVYKSAVHITPLLTPVLIDGEGVRDIVAAEFEKAGFTPADTDTGAVIITGESARKENAATVLEKLSGFAGEFVVSTAGPDLESVIAGKGSGAWKYSVDHACVTVNLDIGGGTTNIVVFHRGDVTAKGCYDIGGRLIRISPEGRVQSVSPAAAAAAKAAGVSLIPGDRADMQTLSAVTNKMAELLAEAMGLLPPSPLLRQVKTPGSTDFIPPDRPARICFSGGVADCIREDLTGDPFRFGDVGPLLGRSIREGLLYRTIPAMEAGETIRATVVGAGTYTTTLSGSTIAYDAALFPLKNVPVLKLTAAEEEAAFRGNEKVLSDRMAWFAQQSGSARMLLSLRGRRDPAYSEVKTLAACLARAADLALPPGEPLLIGLREDMAKALGAAIAPLLRGRPLVSIDSVQMEDGDYVDLGRPLMNGLVIPVVVKTLLFG